MTSVAQGRFFISDALCRLRFEVPGLYGDPALAAKISQTLTAIDGVASVEPNPLTGRVLVTLSSNDKQLVRTIESRLREFFVPYADTVPSLRGLSRNIGRALKHRLSNLQKWCSRREGDASDAAPSNAPPWHALDTEETLRHFRVSPTIGLGFGEVERIRHEVGRNVLAGINPRSRLDILAGQVFTLPTALLFGAAGLSLMLGDIIEAGAIVLVVGCNITVGYFSESRAEDLLHAWGELRAEWATVLRDGHEALIPAADVVPGDVLIVRAGDALPADARIVSAHELSVDESMLTGESEPAEKSADAVALTAPVADRHGMLYAGTIVATGTGRAIVVATGQQTELGGIQRALGSAEERVAPLEQQLDALGKRIAILAVASSFTVIGLGLVRGQSLSVLLRSAVALGVAAIPEGFPAVGTTALALASRRLEREGIVIRRLAAAETLGAVGVICADKTGTLTVNRMRVQEVYLESRGPLRIAWDRAAHEHAQIVDASGNVVPKSDLRDLARIAALNADVIFDDRGQITSGSGTERALVEFAMALDYPAAARRKTARRIREERRTPQRPYMLTVHDHPELGRIELIKGAPEQIIALSTGLSEDDRKTVLAQNDLLASRGLRVLALAWRKDSQTPGYTFVGLVGLEDPPRPGVRDAMSILSRAGITTLMLTGDQRKTALAIGQALGIPESQVFSRVTPVAKLEVVKQLQNEGNIVAMTGDGVNDGPALKAADVGIAMGKRGTDIARAVADVVLAQDDLPSIAIAVAEGRRLHDNVRRAIHYLSTTNLSEVMTMLLGATVGVTPLGPLQLLWINILTDVAPALALAVEPPEADIMQRPPRDPNAPLFLPTDVHRILRRAALMAAGSLSSYGLGIVGGAGANGARTMAFLSLVTSQILYTHNCQADSGQKNPALRWAVVGSFGLQAAALGIPGLRNILGIQLIGPIALGTSLLIGALPAWVTRRTTRTAPADDSIITLERLSFESKPEEHHP